MVFFFHFFETEKKIFLTSFLSMKKEFYNETSFTESFFKIMKYLFKGLKKF